MYKEILLPIDLDQPNSWQQSLPTSIDYCQAFNARLHVLSVIPDFGMSLVGQFFPKDHEAKMRRKANHRLHKFVQEHVPNNVTVQHIISESANVYEEIINIANEINVDLIVMAAHRPELRDYLLGPNASRVVRHAKQSVLVVRS
jgi:nucleotide-binding universal stress UspA family protein